MSISPQSAHNCKSSKTSHYSEDYQWPRCSLGGPALSKHSFRASLTQLPGTGSSTVTLFWEVDITHPPGFHHHLMQAMPKCTFTLGLPHQAQPSFALSWEHL